MPDQSDIEGARHGGHPFAALLRLWRWLVDGLAALGTILIGVLMLIICADIVARNLMGSSLPLISELGALTLVMIVYLQLAATVRADRLARTELFISSFRQNFPRAGNLLSAIFDLVGAWLIGLAAWSTVRILEKDYGSGEFIGVPGIATLQTWPFRVLILIGISVAAIEFVFRALSAMRTAVTGKRP